MMIKTYIKFGFLLTFLIILDSCRKELDIDIPNKERSIVVNGVLIPSNQILINITRSTHVLDDVIYDTIKKVNVTISENNNLTDSLINYGNGYHILNNIIPESGNTYSITVTAPDFKTVASEFTMPQPVEISSFDSSTVFLNEDDNEIKYYYEILFQDPPGERNYYAFDLIQRSPYIQYFIDTITGLEYYNPFEYNPPDYYPKPIKNLKPIVEYNEYPVQIESDEIIFDDYSQGISYSGKLFSDELFDGKKFTLRFYIRAFNYSDDYYYEDPYNPYPSYDDYFKDLKSKYIAQLSSLSEELYLYLKSYYHHNAMKNQFDEFWLENLLERREPVPVYTNIENGYGIFGGYSISIDSLEVNRDLNPYYYY